MSNDYIAEEKPKSSDFGDCLAGWKRKSEWSDQRICDATGLDRTTVAAIRLGRNRPQWRTRVLLWEKLPGFRRFCKEHAPQVLEKFMDGAL